MERLGEKTRYGLGFALSLALITVLGPVATDMYLPSMPEIARQFGTSYSNVQLSLGVFLAAEGAGQLIFGPVVDRLGRRGPLLLGITFFVLSSFGAMLSATIESLIFFRLLQGLAASLSLVVAMSQIRDVADGARAAWLFAVMVTIEGIAPVLAPFFGGIIDSYIGWRAIMATFGLMGLIALANSFFNLSETLPREKRIPLNLSLVFRNYARIAADVKFLLPALSVSCAFFFLFAYAGGASYVYQNIFGLSPDSFGLVFGATGLAVLFGAFSSAKLVGRLGTWTLSVLGALMILTGAVVSVISAFSALGFFGIVAGMFAAMFGLGIAEANMVAIAMSSQKTAVGSTAALLGSLKLVAAAMSTPFAAYFAEKGSVPWLVFLFLAAVATMVCAVASLRWSRESEMDTVLDADEELAAEMS